MDHSDHIISEEHHRGIAGCIENRKVDLMGSITRILRIPKTNEELTFILYYRRRMLHLLIGEDIAGNLATEKFNELHLHHLSEEDELVGKDDEER